MISFSINGKKQAVNLSPNIPLLWVLRDHLKLTGTKYGCGEGLCGACTVHINGIPYRSCITPLEDVKGKKITTIEGIPEKHPIKKAWLVEEVSQCGYCQPGQIMSAAALLAQKSLPDNVDIDKAMSGNICRCGSYGRIRRAIHTAAGKRAKGGKKS